MVGVLPLVGDIKTIVLGDVVSLYSAKGKPQGQTHNIIRQLIYLNPPIIVRQTICGSISMLGELNLDEFGGKYKF